jgi:hypothetical protein
VTAALRVAIWVRLLDDTGAVVQGTAASNSNGANVVEVSTGDRIAGSSRYKTLVFWAIRWDDNHLSKGSSQMPALYDPNG